MNRKPTRREQEILASYNFFDDEDVSTERLLALVCDDCDCEVDEVVSVLTLYYGKDEK